MYGIRNETRHPHHRQPWHMKEILRVSWILEMWLISFLVGALLDCLYGIAC